jgi:hypothetical protein
VGIAGGATVTQAMKKMQNIGWLALVFVVLILLYPLSLNVAAVHSDLVRIDRKIMETKREISFLEAELTTRANIAQLEEWNQLLYGYEPPTAEQFLNGEQGLASLGGGEAVVKPVMVSASMSDGIAPAGLIGRPGAMASKLVDTEIDNGASERTAAASTKAPARVASAQSQSNKNSAISTNGPTKRTEQLAKIDEQLLSDTVLKDIHKRSEKERKRQ